MIGGMIMIKKILSQWTEPTSTKQYQFYRDGITDALLYGRRDEKKLDEFFFSHFYKRGYDFGMWLWSEQDEDAKDEKDYGDRI